MIKCDTPPLSLVTSAIISKMLEYCKMIRIIAGGKKHASWLAEACAEYEKRLKKPFVIEWQFVDEEKLPERVARLKSDDYMILGVGPDCEGIDSDILECFDISFEKIKEVNSSKYAYELIKLAESGNGVVVDCGKTDKPSFDAYFLQYRSDNIEKIIYAFTADNKSVVEIIVAPRGDISKKEIKDMYGSLRYSYY